MDKEISEKISTWRAKVLRGYSESLKKRSNIQQSYYSEPSEDDILNLVHATRLESKSVFDYFLKWWRTDNIRFPLAADFEGFIKQIIPPDVVRIRIKNMFSIWEAKNKNKKKELLEEILHKKAKIREDLSGEKEKGEK